MAKYNATDGAIQYKGYIKITRVSKRMKDECRNIADHLGISVTDFLKVRILDIIASAPPHYRVPFKKD